jgi:hypothetical protein
VSAWNDTVPADALAGMARTKAMRSAIFTGATVPRGLERIVDAASRA